MDISVYLLAIHIFSVSGELSACGNKPKHSSSITSRLNHLFARIFGGENTEPHAWSWQLSLQFKAEASKPFKHICGAVLLDQYFALTAAHCVDGRKPHSVELDPSRKDVNNFRLVLGAHDISEVDTKPTAGLQIRQIDMLIPHPKWVYDEMIGYPNDIALIRMKDPVDPDRVAMSRACLPDNAYADFTDSSCWITGWGKTYWRDPVGSVLLQEAQLSAISNEDCRDIHYGKILHTHICAGEGNPNVCEGDSGGPLSCLKDGTWYVAGIASYAVVTCNGQPAVYTRLSSYLDWIAATRCKNTPAWCICSANYLNCGLIKIS